MTTYFAQDGKVYAKLQDGTVEEAATALSANGRDVERHDRALQQARRQRETSVSVQDAAPVDEP